MSPVNQADTPMLLFHASRSGPAWSVSKYDIAKFNRFLSRCKKQDIVPTLLFDDGLEDVYTDFFPVLQRYKTNTVVAICTDLINTRSGFDLYGKQTFLSLQQLKTLAGAGIHIASHSATHAPLGVIPEKKVHAELYRSWHWIADTLGSAPQGISFPFGSFSLRAWEIAQTVGYTNGFLYGHGETGLPPGITAVRGVYRFDSVEALCAKARLSPQNILLEFRDALLPFFSRASVVLYKHRYK